LLKETIYSETKVLIVSRRESYRKKWRKENEGEREGIDYLVVVGNPV